MSYDIIRDVWVKHSRDMHKCEGCLRMIPAGGMCNRTDFRDGRGGVGVSYLCFPCYRHLNDHWDDYEDNWRPGDLGRNRRDDFYHRPHG